MKDITDTDYMHTKNACKEFKIKCLGEYLDFYLKRDTLWLIFLKKSEKYV